MTMAVEHEGQLISRWEVPSNMDYVHFFAGSHSGGIFYKKGFQNLGAVLRKQSVSDVQSSTRALKLPRLS